MHFEAMAPRVMFDDPDEVDNAKIMRKLERLGRKCYKSEDKITPESSAAFVRNLIKRGHTSVLEHVHVTVTFICDRGVTHELVRHRIAAYSQESTRYCNYYGDKLRYIDPAPFMTEAQHKIWCAAMENASIAYNDLTAAGCTPQMARSVLPNSLKTDIGVTFNLHQWRHVFTLRTAKAAHPQMREVMCKLLDMFKIKLPVIFEDITYEG